MPVLQSNLIQYEGENELDSLNRFVTDIDSFLNPKAVLSCFRNEGEESQTIKFDEDTNKLSGQTIDIGEFSSPIIKLPSISHRRNQMVSLQKWEGYIIGVADKSLLVRLINLTSKGPDEEAEIPIEEISEDDRDLIKPGAIFYWNIGYLDSYAGQRTRISVIRFQRLPSWSEDEIHAAKREADQLQKIFGWE